MEKLGSTDPQRIGAYRLLGRLGAGGMGQVYLARSDRGRTVALKLVREELAAQQEFRDRFRQEVQAARRVGSTWTAPVLDADTEADVPWVATGYVAGPSLHATVSGRVAAGGYGPLPERSVRILGAGLAHALKAIHTAGLIHRDLKPSNILLTIDGPRVIDFGIARALDTVTDGGLTRTGALVGSPGFMSPEQVRGERVSAASDVFCLGSVLTYALTGRLPFGAAANEMHALLFRIAQEDPDLTGVTAGLDDLIRGCLHKDPQARPSTDDILALLADDDNSAEPWLPGALIAQLGRHAVELLDSEDPEDAVPADAGAAGAGAGAAGAAPGGGGPADAGASGAGAGGGGPQGDDPRVAAPRDTAPRDTAPRDTEPQDAVPRDAVPLTKPSPAGPVTAAVPEPQPGPPAEPATEVLGVPTGPTAPLAPPQPPAPGPATPLPGASGPAVPPTPSPATATRISRPSRSPSRGTATRSSPHPGRVTAIRSSPEPPRRTAIRSSRARTTATPTATRSSPVTQPRPRTARGTPRVPSTRPPPRNRPAGAAARPSPSSWSPCWSPWGPAGPSTR